MIKPPDPKDKSKRESKNGDSSKASLQKPNDATAGSPKIIKQVPKERAPAESSSTNGLSSKVTSMRVRAASLLQI